MKVETLASGVLGGRPLGQQMPGIDFDGSLPDDNDPPDSQTGNAPTPDKNGQTPTRAQARTIVSACPVANLASPPPPPVRAGDCPQTLQIYGSPIRETSKTIDGPHSKVTFFVPLVFNIPLPPAGKCWCDGFGWGGYLHFDFGGSGGLLFEDHGFLYIGNDTPCDGTSGHGPDVLHIAPPGILNLLEGVEYQFIDHTGSSCVSSGFMHGYEGYRINACVAYTCGFPAGDVSGYHLWIDHFWLQLTCWSCPNPRL